MSKQLIRTHHLRRNDLLGLEGYHQGISNNQLGLGGSVFPEQVLSARQGLVKGELFIHSQSPELPLIKYSRDYRNYYLNPEAIGHYEPSALAAISQRFPELDNNIAERLAQGLRRGQIIDTGVSLDPPEPLDYHFEGNNMDNGVMTRNFWLKARFVTPYVSHQQDKADRRTVAGVPYKLYNNDRATILLAEGISTAEGYIEWDSHIIQRTGYFVLEWANPGSDEYHYTIDINALQAHNIPLFDPMHEILYSPNEHYILALDKAGLNELEAYDSEFDKAARTLQTARDQNRDAQLNAQSGIRQLLRKHTAQAPSDGTLAPLTTGKADFIEVIRLGAHKYSLVPQAFIEQQKQKHGTFTPFTIGHDSSNSLDSNNKKDALAPWRHPVAAQKADPSKKAGGFDGDAFKKTVNTTKVNVVANWNTTLYTKHGQINSRHIVAGVFGESIAKFFDDELSLFDDWIAQVNEDTNVSFRQYEQYQAKAIAALDKNTKPDEEDVKKYFLPEDWDIATRSVLDIWGEEDELYNEMLGLTYTDIKPDKERRDIREKIAHKALPSTQWDASAGAQFMRYNLGASATANFSPLKQGKIAIGASGEFDAALAEAKAEGSFYFPANTGYALTPRVIGKQEHIKYKAYGLKSSGRFIYDKARTGNVFIDHLNEHVTPDQYPPYFIANSSLVTPAAAAGIFSLFKHYHIVAQTGERQSLDLNQRGIFVQIIGHASAPGSPQENQLLGLRRAAATADFMQQQNSHWLSYFARATWGKDEADFMGYFIAYQNHSPVRKATKNIDWQAIGEGSERIASITAQLRQHINLEHIDAQSSRELLPDHSKDIYFRDQNQWQSALPELLRSYLPTLIQQYQQALLHYGANAIGKPGEVNSLKAIRLHTSPVVSKVESQQAQQAQTEAHNNRRCEFIAYEVDPLQSTVVKGRFKLDLGHMRARIQGTIGAWAGVNIALGGEIAIAAPEGKFAVIGAIADTIPEQQLEQADGDEPTDKSPSQDSDKGAKQAKASKQSKHKDTTIVQHDQRQLIAGVNASAYAGAKAELGLKSSIDWRQPQPAATTTGKAAGLSTFKAFGSVGYTATGLLGVGYTGEFKVGFNARSGRFILKAQAQAALGPGIGGQIDIVIDIGHTANFVAFVHDQLKRHHFSYLDMFETIAQGSDADTFSLFSALSWKLLSTGSPLSAGVNLVKGIVADQLVDLLRTSTELIDEWKRDSVESAQVNTLIETLNQAPEHMYYLTPETKGRILFDLISVSHAWRESLSNVLDIDLNKRREDATVLLLTKGIHSAEDWRETFEHIGQWQGDKLQFRHTRGASAVDKAERLRRNLEAVRAELLDDAEKWDTVMDHYQKLLDTPPSTSTIIPAAAAAPTNTGDHHEPAP